MSCQARGWECPPLKDNPLLDADMGGAAVDVSRLRTLRSDLDWRALCEEIRRVDAARRIVWTRVDAARHIQTAAEVAGARLHLHGAAARLDLRLLPGRLHLDSPRAA